MNTDTRPQSRFHVKRGLLLLLVASGLLALLSTACVRAASSRGWAQPVEMQSGCSLASSTVSGAGSCLLITPKKGKLDAIDPQTGDRKWRFPDDFSIWNKKAEKLGGIYSKPEVAGDTVFIGDYNGFVYAFKPSEASSDKANRKPVGLFNVGSAVIGGITLDSGSQTLYVTTADGRLFALNSSDLANATSSDKNVRSLFSSFDAGDRIWTPPVLAGGRVYFGTTAGKLFAIDARTAEPVWEPFEAGAALVSTPVVSGDTVLIGGFDRRLYAVDVSTGREKWHFDATDWIWSKPLVDGGRVYVADFNGKVFALSISDGSEVWSQPFDANGIVRASPTLSGGALVVVNDSGEVFGIEPSTGNGSWGPVRVGTSVKADLLASGTTIYLAPTRCTEEATEKLYYFKINTTTRERQSTGSVCG